MFTNIIIAIALLSDPTRGPPDDIVIEDDVAEGHDGRCGIVEQGAGCYTIYWGADPNQPYCICAFLPPPPSPCREGDCSV